jgi:hypothetical protein
VIRKYFNGSNLSHWELFCLQIEKDLKDIKSILSWAPVVHICDHSDLGGTDQENCGSKQPRQIKYFPRPYLENT